MQKTDIFVLKLLQQSAVYSIVNEHLRIRSNAGGKKSLFAKVSDIDFVLSVIVRIGLQIADYDTPQILDH